MILILMVSEKGIVELVVEEGTMKFAGKKVGTLKSSNTSVQLQPEPHPQ